MSESIPSYQPSEAQSSMAETYAAQKYEDALAIAENLHQVSTVSVQEAVNEMANFENKLLYAVPDNEGVLVMDRSNPYNKSKNYIVKAGVTYQRTINRAAAYGYLPPDAYDAYRNTFSTGSPETMDPNALFTSEFLADPIRMYLHGCTAPEGPLLETAKRLDLDTSSLDNLGHITETIDAVANSPTYGSNFLYHYSTPFIETGTRNGEVTARLGVTVIRDNDGSGLRHVSFHGVSIPAEHALNMITENIEAYARQAEVEKATASEAPALKGLLQAILEQREANARAFVDQLKSFAPESTSFSDDELLTIVKTTALNNYGNGQAYPDTSPTELHMINVIIDKNAGFSTVGRNNDGKTPLFWEPHSYLFANGRTGSVTRVDYEDSPAHPGTKGRETGRITFDAEESARLRQQMFVEVTDTN